MRQVAKARLNLRRQLVSAHVRAILANRAIIVVPMTARAVGSIALAIGGVGIPAVAVDFRLNMQVRLCGIMACVRRVLLFNAVVMASATAFMVSPRPCNMVKLRRRVAVCLGAFAERAHGRASVPGPELVLCGALAAAIGNTVHNIRFVPFVENQLVCRLRANAVITALAAANVRCRNVNIQVGIASLGGNEINKLILCRATHAARPAEKRTAGNLADLNPIAPSVGASRFFFARPSAA